MVIGEFCAAPTRTARAARAFRAHRRSLPAPGASAGKLAWRLGSDRMEATMGFDLTLTRRGFAGAMLGSLVLPGLPAFAKAPAVRIQAPGVYRQSVGSFEVTVLND